MNSIARTLTLATVLTVGALAASPASAQHRRHYQDHGPRVSFGISFGAPIGWYYAPPPSPYYYYHYPRRVVVVPADPPPVYVEREVAPPAPVAENYWYYCADSGAYYPYVRDCATSWQRVAPRPN